MLAQVLHDLDQSDQYFLPVGHQVLDPLERAGHDANETQNGVLHRWLVDAEQVDEKLIAYAALQEKHVVSYQLVNQVLAQLGRYLQGVDSKGEQHLDDSLDVALLLRLYQLVLVLRHYSLTEQFRSVGSAFGGEDLIVLVKLYLVVLNCLRQRRRICDDVAIFYVVQLLQAVYCNRKNLSGRLQH